MYEPVEFNLFKLLLFKKISVYKFWKKIIKQSFIYTNCVGNKREFRSRIIKDEHFGSCIFL